MRETDTFFPKEVDPLAGTVTWRRQVRPILNAQDYLRHHVLHTFWGSSETNFINSDYSGGCPAATRGSGLTAAVQSLGWRFGSPGLAQRE
jgi:hypothetical protein